MSIDIQLGDVEQARPERHRRPDRNLHFSVQPYGALCEGELPIFVHWDVMRDIEAHACSNIGVELGGVLLGRQYTDEDGHDFVLIQDALRAQHYEATKASFKFTHDTWSEITRQREKFPDEMQMVGWYHTHPDWGVFLSEMDRFICDHFFNKPLDVALVIDPCGSDRGFFQWSDDSNSLLRTGGFYVISSRFRQRELGQFVSQLERTSAMTIETSYVDSTTSSYPAPVIHNHLAGTSSVWLPLAVLGMLAAQLLLTILIAYGAIFPRSVSERAISTENQIQMRAERIDQQNKFYAAAVRTAAAKETLDEVIRQLDVQTDGLSSQLQLQREKNETLRAAIAGFQALEDRVAVLDRELQQSLSSHAALTEKLNERHETSKLLADENKAVRAKAAQLDKNIEQLSALIEQNEQDAAELSRIDPVAYERWQQVIAATGEVPTASNGKASGNAEEGWPWNWETMVAATVLVVTALIGGVVFIRRRAYFEEQR